LNAPALSAVNHAPIVIVLTGPSGVGKDALIDRLAETGVPIVRPPTMTTRPPRPGEVEGTHHYFVTREAFAQQLASGELLEHAEYDGNLYGVPRRSVRAALSTGRHVVLRVDVQGAESIRRLLPAALFISLEPESLEVLRGHLEARGTEQPEQIARRLSTAREEIDRARAFCLPVTNVEHDLDATVAAVRSLIEREQARADRAPIEV
jgi:guanylate kinase